MDLLSTVRGYAEAMLSGAGIKALLMDSEAAGIISLVMPQSAIAKMGVHLVERLDKPSKEVMADVSAVVFVRPSPVHALAAIFR